MFEILAGKYKKLQKFVLVSVAYLHYLMSEFVDPVPFPSTNNKITYGSCIAGHVKTSYLYAYAQVQSEKWLLNFLLMHIIPQGTSMTVVWLNFCSIKRDPNRPKFTKFPSVHNYVCGSFKTYSSVYKSELITANNSTFLGCTFCKVCTWLK